MYFNLNGLTGVYLIELKAEKCDCPKQKKKTKNKPLGKGFEIEK